MSRFPSFSRPPPKQFKARRPQPVAEVLNRTDAFVALRAGVEQIAALEKDLRELLPDYLATSVEPSFIKEGVLALFAGAQRAGRPAAPDRAAVAVGSAAARLAGQCAEDSRAAAAFEGAAAGQAGAHDAGRRGRAARALRIARALAAAGSFGENGGAASEKSLNKK